MKINLLKILLKIILLKIKKVNEDYNYYKYSDTIKSNSYIETYNKYIKSQLGNKKYVNWVNFLNFLKTESERSIKKLVELANHNVKFSKKNLNLV